MVWVCNRVPKQWRKQRVGGGVCCAFSFEASNVPNFRKRFFFSVHAILASPSQSISWSLPPVIVVPWHFRPKRVKRSSFSGCGSPWPMPRVPPFNVKITHFSRNSFKRRCDFLLWCLCLLTKMAASNMPSLKDPFWGLELPSDPETKSWISPLFKPFALRVFMLCCDFCGLGSHFSEGGGVYSTFWFLCSGPWPVF